MATQIAQVGEKHLDEMTTQQDKFADLQAQLEAFKEVENERQRMLEKNRENADKIKTLRAARIAEVKKLVHEKIEPIIQEIAGLDKMLVALGFSQPRPNRRARKCSVCGESGHNSATCPARKSDSLNDVALLNLLT